MSTGSEDKTGWDRFQVVIEEHQSSLIRYARSIVSDLERAKDVVQDVFVKLCRKPDELDKDHLVPWLYRATRNQALDILRKEKRMSFMENPDQATALASVGESAAGEQRRADTIDSLLDLVRQLTGKQREVVLLKFQQGLSYKEISEVTGLTQSNVGYVLHHALKELKARWKAVESV